MKKTKPVIVLKSPEQVPDFASEQAEAEFWQTHSPVEIFDQLPAADDVRFHRAAKRLIPLPLNEELYEELRRRAHKEGISPLTLIQQWIEARLKNVKRGTDKRAKQERDR